MLPLAALGARQAPVPLDRAHVEAEFDALQTHVIENGASPDFCATWAADVALCAASLEGAHLPAAGPDEIDVIIHDGVAEVVVRGRDGAGRAYICALEYVQTDDGLRAVDPVFWRDRGLIVVG